MRQLVEPRFLWVHLEISSRLDFKVAWVFLRQLAGGGGLRVSLGYIEATGRTLRLWGLV